jgi:N-acetylglucosamine PTS system EIICBA or EIICB component
MRSLAGLQSLGRALMLPIAVLPVAGLLLRLGQPDLLNLAPMAAAGGAVFQNLGLLFAIGVAVGLARENHGAAGLAAVVGYVIATKGAEVLLKVPPEATAALSGASAELAAAAYKTRELGKLSVPIGLISGLIAGASYNRYGDIRLPSYLAFFGGRRFVPIVCGFFGLIVAGAFGLGWPWLERGMDALSHAVISSGSIGLFAYGTLNRLLIITGLHHILNNLAWFLIGDYHGVTGDLNRFFAGDPNAGAFMSGFFPVMMFGLPGACLAMYRTASSDRQRAVSGLLLSMALTSFLTGVTEPIEFSFIFLAPVLYAVHALLTGAAMVIMHVLGVHLGFGFSAGLFDYVLNYSKATHPLLLVPIGLAYFALYYGLFRFVILRLNLPTPGRETTPVATELPAGEGAEAFVTALGGAGNLLSVDACTTRLRLVVRESARIDRAALASLGARGVMDAAGGVVQVVLGPIADQVAGEIRAALKAPAAAPRVPAATTGVIAATAIPALPIAPILAALGGVANILELEGPLGRVLATVHDPALVDLPALSAAGARRAVVRGPLVHLLLGAASGPTLRALREATSRG